MKKTIKNIIISLLVFSMFFGLFQTSFYETNNSLLDACKKDEISKDDRSTLEKIATLVGNEDNDFQKMTDSQLQEYIDNQIAGLEISRNSENLTIKELGVSTDKSDNKVVPSINVDKHSNEYNEQGEMKNPFDQIYPELMDSEFVQYDKKTVLVKLSNKFNGEITPEMKKIGVISLKEVFPMEKSTWFEAFLKKGSNTSQVISGLRDLKYILLADFNYQIRTAAMDNYEEVSANITSNKLVAHQWHLNYCGIGKGTKLLNNEGGSSSVVVAVIDTGVDYDHEDLADNIWINKNEIPDNGKDDDNNGYVDDYYGVDIVSGKGSGDDDNGHGTHVAGIIAARNNHIGTVGIAYNTKIMPIKAATASGYLNSSDIAKAIYYAYENGAEVINMSFGGSNFSIAAQDALSTAYTRCVLVASAGNDSYINEGEDIYNPVVPNYPAALSYVIGVMSVGRTGVESQFSNFDYKAFTNTEYEVYAPGEEILSTIPNNQYASWSGTSMAAPMVSAVAALIRSKYMDRNVYPNKFIYGQIAATSDNSANCSGHSKYPNAANSHNIPKIVNLYSALTKLPRPEISISDHVLFDTNGFDQDKNNKNNGNGTIDAGETVAIGLSLRNRWGMSKNTTVTIDTLSSAGIPDPYVEIINPSVEYGSIGTYSTGDCGKIYKDDLFVGWENPFYIRISEECPNDYVFRVNVNITYENGLDETDRNVYTSEQKSTIDIYVRNGYVLPSVIKENMTLTPDNLYIIPNATTILEGVTVRVEPGTHIQFWSNDETDTYSDNYIAYLRVEGDFIVEGTAENPVYIYPSDLMRDYAVKFGGINNGHVFLKHADVTNYFEDTYTVTYAENCVFKKNTSNILRFRSLSSGKVYDRTIDYGRMGNFTFAKNSVFYKINHNLTYGSTADLKGNFDTCAFIDCGIDYSMAQNIFSNCLFYGNRAKTDESNVFVSSTYTANQTSVFDIDPSQFEVVYCEKTGTTYVSVSGVKANTIEPYLGVLGWKYAIIETEDELEWLQGTSLSNSTVCYNVGIQKNNDDTFEWSNGTEVGEFFERNNSSVHIDIYNGRLMDYNETNRNLLFEVTGEIYVSDIGFDEYEIYIDMESDYTLKPITAPVPMLTDGLIYESTDESVATVDKNGQVIPVSKGVTDIYVYSKDKAVKNYVTVNVVDYKPIERILFNENNKEIELGKEEIVFCSFEPADTTRRNPTFKSSAPDIVSIDEKGVITGKTRGQAVITASCDGVVDEMIVTSYKKADRLAFKDVGKVYSTLQEKVELPKVEYGDADVNLTYESSDDSVATIQNEQLIIKDSGVITLRVTDERTGLNDEIIIYITSENSLPTIKFIGGSRDGGTYAFFEDGRVYEFRSKSFIFEDVADFYVGADYGGSYSYYSLLKNDGSVMYGNSISSLSIMNNLSDVDRVFAGKNTYFALDKNGICYAWGDNDSNCSGTGFSGKINEPKMINLENIVDIFSTEYYDYSFGYKCYTYFLDREGRLYLSGGKDSYSVPTLVSENVSKIEKSGNGGVYILKKGKWYSLIDASESGINSVTSFNADTDGEHPGFGILDGILFDYGVNNYIPNIFNVSKVFEVGTSKNDFSSDRTTYIICNDNSVYAYGGNRKGQINSFSSVKDVNYEEATIVPTFDYTKKALSVERINLTENILEDESLVVDFNGKLKTCSGLLYADDNQIPYKLTAEFDKIKISLAGGFKEDVNYKYVIVPTNVSCELLDSFPEEVAFEFTYKGEKNDDNADEKIHEAVVDESVERFYHTAENLLDSLNKICEKYNPYFYNNVILNRISTELEPERWLRIVAPTSSSFSEIALGNNYWGTTDEGAIGLQIVDFSDFSSYAKLNYTPYLSTPPENTFPFVTDVKVFNANDEEVTTVGNEEITVRVTFNRDMEESIPLQVCFGSAAPYSDYKFEGNYVDARTWEGKMTFSTFIENGNQYFTISNGKAKGTNLQLYADSYRFNFVIDTTAAQALVMQGSATEEGVALTWTQDDFDTLMGYNVYRSTSEDGYYQKINDVVIPAETKEFFDDTVEPGLVYYYNFTVVKTDLSESTPSGKISIRSKDTMAPNVYHTPVYTATLGSNIIINATITDNLLISNARVYYRVVGTEEWNVAIMNNLNDKYSAIIFADEISLEGIEYYIDASDGLSHTYKGSATNPYRITVQEEIGEDSLGDVNGDGKITNLDALMLLQAINDVINLDDEQFARADLNRDGILTAAEALKILQYVSGIATSVRM